MEIRIKKHLERSLLTTEEASQLTGIPVITLHKWAQRGKLDYIKKGRVWLYYRKDVEKLGKGKASHPLPKA